MSPRWEPDEQLVAAVMSGSPQTMGALSPPDRCWLVAGLTVLGLTAEDIADRLDCSLRLVRSIRAEDMTQVCLRMQEETNHFANELRLARSEHRAVLAALARMTAERDRVRSTLARAIGDCCGQGHAFTQYNTYVTPQGKRQCRECHRERTAKYRSRLRSVTPESSQS